MAMAICVPFLLEWKRIIKRWKIYYIKLKKDIKMKIYVSKKIRKQGMCMQNLLCKVLHISWKKLNLILEKRILEQAAILQRTMLWGIQTILNHLTMEYWKITVTMFPSRQSLFPSELIKLPWQSPLLANTRKYCKLTESIRENIG